MFLFFSIASHAYMQNELLDPPYSSTILCLSFPLRTVEAVIMKHKFLVTVLYRIAMIIIDATIGSFHTQYRYKKNILASNLFIDF